MQTIANPPVESPAAQTRGWYLVAVCLTATLGGLLFGYDTGVISGGIESLTARFNLDVVMKGWASGCVLLGCALGVLLAGPFSDRFGRRASLFVAAILFLVSSIGTAVPDEIRVFIAFRILGGVGIGIASMTTPMYIAEIAPAHLRGRLVALNQIAIVGGIVLVYFVSYFIARSGDVAWNVSQGWRWMFASGAIPALVFFGLLFAIPESPRWLFAAGREGDAKAVLQKVGGAAYAERESDSIQASLQAQEST